MRGSESYPELEGRGSFWMPDRRDRGALRSLRPAALNAESSDARDFGAAMDAELPLIPGLGPPRPPPLGGLFRSLRRWGTSSRLGPCPGSLRPNRYIGSHCHPPHRRSERIAIKICPKGAPVGGWGFGGLQPRRSPWRSHKFIFMDARGALGIRRFLRAARSRITNHKGEKRYGL
jgi:hypothetical protein